MTPWPPNGLLKSSKYIWDTLYSAGTRCTFLVSINVSKRKLMCTEIRMLRNGFNIAQIKWWKGTIAVENYFFFCFSSSGVKLLKNVHLQLSTMLTRGGNKELDDLQFLHLFLWFFSLPNVKRNYITNKKRFRILHVHSIF